MMTYQLAVFGNPIQHSLSPKIHPVFAAQFGISINYQKILVPIHEFSDYCQKFFEKGGYGCNITAPFKGDAYQLATHHFVNAKQVKAVNTLVKRDNALWGDSTDGQGLINDLMRNKKFDLQQRKIIIIGAGGVTRSILPALLAANPAQVILVNRTENKAKALLQDHQFPENLHVVAWDELSQAAASCDLLLDATSSHEIMEHIAHLPWSKKVFFYDLKYHLHETPLTHWARNAGYQACDGFGMLVEQAALSFERWFNVLPDTQRLILLGARGLTLDNT